MILFVGVGNLNTIKYSLEANVSPFKFWVEILVLFWQ